MIEIPAKNNAINNNFIGSEVTTEIGRKIGIVLSISF